MYRTYCFAKGFSLLFAGVFLTASLRPAPAVDTLPAWFVPTEMDNHSINRCVIAGQPAFIVPAGGHFHILRFDGANWYTAAVLDPPGRAYHVAADTNLLVALNATTNVFDFYAVEADGRGARLARRGTAPGPDAFGGIKAARAGSLLCYRGAGDYSLWQCAIGQTPQHLPELNLFMDVRTWTEGYWAVNAAAGSVSAWAWREADPLTVSTQRWDLASGGAEWHLVGASGLWFWRGATGALDEFVPPAWSPGRALALPGYLGVDRVTDLPTDRDVLLSAIRPGAGGHAIIRAAGDGAVRYARDAVATDYPLVGPAGRVALAPCWYGSNTKSARLLRLADGRTLTHGLFADNGPDVGQALIEHGGRCFAAKACFWWDGVEIREVDPERGPWDAPNAWSWVRARRPIVVFPETTVGGTAQAVIPITNTLTSARATVALVSGAGSPDDFNVPTQWFQVPGNAAGSVTVEFRPRQPGATWCEVRILDSGSGSYDSVILAGRTPDARTLPAACAARLDRDGATQARYLTDPRTMNLAARCPKSWHSDTLPADQGGYCNPHEIGLGMLAAVAAARRGWLDWPACWTHVDGALATLETLQGKPAEFPANTFWHFYRIKAPDGRDLAPGEVCHDASHHPSSDDAALLAHSLLMVRTAAARAQRGATVAAIERILRRLDLRRFVTADGSAIAMWRSPAGAYSADTWNTAGAEGPAILAALYLLNQCTTDEFARLAGNLRRDWGTWRGTHVPDGDWHAALFVRGVRAQAGLPVVPDDAPGCTYGLTLLPLLAAQFAWADAAGWDTVLSHVMTQTVGGVGQTGRGAGNTDGADPTGQVRSAPHAWYVPFARPQWLPAADRDRLLAMMDAYASQYFDAAGLGWEAAVPLQAAGPHQGTDAGRAWEALTGCYIVLSCHDALQIAEDQPPLAELHPLSPEAAGLMEAIDARGPVAIPPLRILDAARAGNGALTLDYVTVGRGWTTGAVETAAAPGAAFAPVAPIATTNVFGGLYRATVPAPGAQAFYRVAHE